MVSICKAAKYYKIVSGKHLQGGTQSVTLYDDTEMKHHTFSKSDVASKNACIEKLQAMFELSAHWESAQKGHIFALFKGRYFPPRSPHPLPQSAARSIFQFI